MPAYIHVWEQLIEDMVWELDKSTLQCINYVAYIYTKNELMYRKVAVETIAQGLSGNIQWESAM